MMAEKDHLQSSIVNTRNGVSRIIGHTVDHNRECRLN